MAPSEVGRGFVDRGEGMLGGMRGCDALLGDGGVAVVSRGMDVVGTDGAVAAGGDGEVGRDRGTEEIWALGDGEGGTAGVGEVGGELAGGEGGGVCREGVVRGSLLAGGVRGVGGMGGFEGADHFELALDVALDEGGVVVGLVVLVGDEFLDYGGETEGPLVVLVSAGVEIGKC
jgi:hypothetical protein